MLQRADGTLAVRPNTSTKKHMKALTMKFVPPDTCLKDYKKRRNSFLNDAKEFRRWIDENSPYSDNDEA